MLGSPRATSIAVVVLVGLPLLVFGLVSAADAVFGSGEADPSAGAPPPALRVEAPVDLSRPFAGTPAIDWPEGEAGITAPPAVRIGRYTAEDVATATAAVRRLIATARLDRHVLETHDAEPVLALLAPHQAAEARALLRPGNEAETWWISTKIAPGFRLLPVAPRVTGWLTPIVDAKGELVIKTNVLVAYAFDADDPRTLTGPLDIIAVDRWEADYIWVHDAQYDAGSQGLYYGDVRGYMYPVGCVHGDKGFLAPNYSNPPFAVPDPNQPDPETFFDPEAELPAESGC
ncbi:hypothetical protein [Nocardia sp. NPDC003345]